MIGTPRPALFDQFARVGKALGSGKRLELLDLLAQGERTVDALARAGELGLTTASAHLQTLKAGQPGEHPPRRHQGVLPARRHGCGRPATRWCARSPSAHLPDVEAARHAYLGPGHRTSHPRRAARADKARHVTVLDVRPREEYAAGHIPGAVSIPLDELADRLAELPDDQTSSPTAAAPTACSPTTRSGCSPTTAARLRLADGMLEWRLADLPVAA